MFERIYQAIQNVKDLNLFKVGVEIWHDKEVSKEILYLNKYGQLFEKGIDAENRAIGFYSMTTSRINPSKKFNTHYTLKDTGEFYASFKVIVYNDGFTIYAKTNKQDDDLIAKFGKDILGLNEDSKTQIKELIKPKIAGFVKDYILKQG